ncbi:MAG: Protease 4 [Bacteroidetes bacterium ADurb.Bin234]|nr:MAG: Protease 4 [Bacteroidetes bacterium ADurb.Bin234]
MKHFFKYVLATITGVLILWLLGIILFFSIIGTLSKSEKSSVTLKPNSVYQLDLKGTLVDRSEENPFLLMASAFGGEENPVLGLDDILANIDKAKNDPNIKGIYLKGGELIGGWASIKEIRDALVDFKKTNKFIVAYADNYMQSNYYLASVADKILLNPEGLFDFRGLSSELVFIKNTLDKLGIQMQIVKVGTYKSAVEPLINTKMSDANREQVSVYLNSLWKTALNDMAASRKIPSDSLNALADKMLMFRDANEAVKAGLVDTLVYVNEADSILKKFIGNGFDKKLLVKHSKMNNVPDKKKFQKDKVAVIYAVGGIDDGDSEGIVSEKLIKTIDEVAEDKMVKAVVFRVSSPGGSAYGSEQIWHALTNLKKQKPLVVSMGDYAASGGYYISCMADQIIAQPNTITGSIGIFGVIPDLSGLNNKIGLTYDGVKTNKMSDAISLNRPFRPEERELMQSYVDRGYELFVKRCADGRGKKVDEIKAIAEGRVWTGEDALKIGLVDKIGGLDEAISIAAERANLKNYMVKDFPEKEDFATKLMKSFGEDMETKFVKARLGENYRLFKYLKDVEKLNGIQARLPYEIIIK